MGCRLRTRSWATGHSWTSGPTSWPTSGVGTQGRVDGPRLTASFMRPLGVALDKPAKPTVVYVADAEGPTIREVEL